MAMSDTPQVSNQGFVNPGTPVIQAMPSIKEVLQYSRPASIPAEKHAPESPVEHAQEEVPVAQEEEKTTEPENVPDVQPKAEEDFATCWKTLFDELFMEQRMIYHSLKGETPEYKDDTIFVTLKNNIQKEEFEMRKKAILEYWRSHYSLNVDDVEFIVNEQKEDKVVIINSEDKLKNMMTQNNQLAEFLQVLQFQIRD